MITQLLIFVAGYRHKTSKVGASIETVMTFMIARCSWFSWWFMVGSSLVGSVGSIVFTSYFSFSGSSIYVASLSCSSDMSISYFSIFN